MVTTEEDEEGFCRQSKVGVVGVVQVAEGEVIFWRQSKVGVVVVIQAT